MLNIVSSTAMVLQFDVCLENRAFLCRVDYFLPRRLVGVFFFRFVRAGQYAHQSKLT